jgi:NAD(P)-dependent dehydrogenase (short-subunit alcohol dehydrogenase family)
MLDYLLNDKVALITGGSSGIGRATVLAFAREGAKIVVADVAVQDGEETVRLINKQDGQACFVTTDATKANDVENMVAKTVGMYGRLDCAVNNAGAAKSGGITECSEENWDFIVSINLKGVWLCMKYELLQMRKQKSGTNVNTASVAGLVHLRNPPALPVVMS